MLNKEQFILLSENLEQAIVYVEVRPVAIATCYVLSLCTTTCKVKEITSEEIITHLSPIPFIKCSIYLYHTTPWQ